MDEQLFVTEIFHSLQGETSLSGVPFTFVRLTGCNLRCTYCDTAYAFQGGEKLALADVIARVGKFPAKDVLLTGGEPLLQKATPKLARLLTDAGYRVSIETHGEAPIGDVVDFCRIVLDVKTPSSGMSRGGFKKNLPHLKPSDEVKFVIASPEDYDWAKETIHAHSTSAREILFSPARAAPGQPGEFPGVEPRWLAERILADGIPVRMQLQLHKLLWGTEARGV